MKVTPIPDPLQRERVVGVEPEIALYPDAGRRRRLNFVPGRTLTHTDLAAEQRWRASRIAALGRTVAPGVLDGLIVTEHVADPAIPALYVSAGRALSVGGELITVNQPVVVRLADLFVQVHDAFTPRPVIESTGIVRPAPALPVFADVADTLPSEGILVLQGLYAEKLDDSETDPCGFDADAFAQTDWQYKDAARLVWYTWPDDWLTLPSGADARRNRVAHAIFDRERRMTADEVHPWQQAGVPIALVGLSADRRAIAYVDSNAVVRAGGGRRGIPDLAPAQGRPQLWQAQFEQFNEQLAERLDAAPDRASAIADTRAAFRYLPPAGVLPRPTAGTATEPDSLTFVDPRARQQDFFPEHFDVACRVVPHEQLDLAVRQSLPLAPFDVLAPAQVEVLVPVPQALFVPDLLTIEALAPEFDATVQRLTDARNDVLGERLDLRLKASALSQAITGKRLGYGERATGEIEFPDTGAVDDFERSTPMHPAPLEMGTVWRFQKGTAAQPATWTAAGFDDSAWQTGPSGFGYGRPGLGTELDDMASGYTSVFLRGRFALDATTVGNEHVLEISTTGGFVVFVNGAEVSRHNVPSGTVGFDAVATGRAADAPHRIVLASDALVAGDNNIAVQAHTHNRAASSFAVLPRVVARTVRAEWPALGVAEDAFGLSFDPTAGDEPAFDAAYTVDAIEALKTTLAETTPLTTEEIAELDAVGLEEFIHQLDARVASTNDKIDFGFVRLQTDIYRIRQFVLGNTEGTKLATSPVLAGIAQGETALATREELNLFVENLKSGGSTSGETGGTEALILPGGAAPTPRRGGGSQLFLSGELSGPNVPTSTVRASAPDRTSLSSGARGGLGAIDPRLAADPRFGGAIDAGISATGAGALAGATSSRTGSALFEQPTTKSVEQQTSIVGSTSQYRDVTVAERLKEPVATNAKTAGIATKAGVLSDFRGAGINLADIDVPGVRDDSGNTIKFADVDDDRLNQILAGDHDPNDTDANGNELNDEAAFFNSGVRALESSAILLRAIEGRIHAYRKAIGVSTETLNDIRTSLADVDARLAETGQALAEARHDLTVARAIRQEELERVNAVNERRQAIVDEHVPFYLFRRPRFSATNQPAPARTLASGFEPPPVPDCEADDTDTPEELSAMIDLVRDAPLRWFTIAPALVAPLRKTQDLEMVLLHAMDAATKTKPPHPRFGEMLSIPGAFLEQDAETALNRTSKIDRYLTDAYAAGYRRVSGERERRRKTNIATNLGRNWRDAAAAVERVASIADVIDGEHGRAGAGQIAGQWLEDMRRVITCLYQVFDDVPASVKLTWIERLGQFDTGIDLSDLHVLPRFEEVPAGSRRSLQRMVDWLYAQRNPSFADASGLIGDLVRACLLLASHAPVNRILTGRTVEPVVPEPGVEVRVAGDIRRVQIGMEVLMQAGDRVVARGEVSDLGNGEMTAHITSGKSAPGDLAAGARVQVRQKQARSARYASASTSTSAADKSAGKTRGSKGRARNAVRGNPSRRLR